MDTAQHAGNILEAWRFRDLSRFNAALDEAFRACMGGIPVSRLEAEREEILQSVVEHLRGTTVPSNWKTSQAARRSRCCTISAQAATKKKILIRSQKILQEL